MPTEIINNVPNTESNMKSVTCTNTTGKAEKWANVSYDELGLRLNQQRWDDPKGRHAIMMTDHLLWPQGRTLAVCALLQRTLHKETSYTRSMRVSIIRITSDLVVSWLVQQTGDIKSFSSFVTRHSRRIPSLTRITYSRVNKLYWYEAQTAEA